MVSRSFSALNRGIKFLRFPPHASQLPWFVLLGLLCGVVGAVFLKLCVWAKTVLQTPLAGLSPAGAAGLIVGSSPSHFQAFAATVIP